MATDWRERLGGPAALAFGGLACARAWLSLLYVSPGAEASFHGWFDVGYVGVGVAVVLAARRIGGFSRWRWPYVTALLSMLAAALCSGAGSVWTVPEPVRAVVACVSGTGFGLLCLLNAESLVRLSHRAGGKRARAAGGAADQSGHRGRAGHNAGHPQDPRSSHLRENRGAQPGGAGGAGGGGAAARIGGLREAPAHRDFVCGQSRHLLNPSRFGDKHADDVPPARAFFWQPMKEDAPCLRLLPPL